MHDSILVDLRSFIPLFTMTTLIFQSTAARTDIVAADGGKLFVCIHFYFALFDVGHNIGRRTTVSEFIGHEFHGAVNMMKESLIPGAEIV